MRDPLMRYAATEIDGDDAEWLRGDMPEDTELVELDEVEFWGATYDRAPGSELYVPTTTDARERAVQRFMAEAEEPAMPVGVDLFAGCGGFSLGMHQGGFDVVAAAEWDVAAAKTYLYNLALPDCRLIFGGNKDRERWDRDQRLSARRSKKDGVESDWSIGGNLFGSAYGKRTVARGGCRAFVLGDVRKITGAQLMDAAGVDHAHVVFGGPPCQGLSTANAKACLEDARNGLLWEFMRLVHEIQPDAFIIENVPALLTVADGALFNAIADLANEDGYDITAQKLNAANYGVPQYRTRAIIVGNNRGIPFQFPMPSHWALGRPAKGKGWTMIGGSEWAGVEDDAIAAGLPRKAHFDRETGTWSVPAKGAKGKKPKAEPKQLDLGDGGFAE